MKVANLTYTFTRSGPASLSISGSLQLTDTGRADFNGFQAAAGTITTSAASRLSLNAGSTISAANVTMNDASRLTVNGSSLNVTYGMAVNGGTVDLAGGVLNVDYLEAAGNSPAIFNINTPGTAITSSSSSFRYQTVLNVTSGRLDLGGLSLYDDARIATTSPTVKVRINVTSLNMFGQSSIDIGNGTLFVSAGFAPRSLNFYRGYLSQGYHGGDWLGTRIKSSFAAANPAYGIGYTDSAVGIVVTVRPSGDCTQDNLVNFNDVLRVAQNYGLSGRFWNDGDFTYDGVVNFEDLLKLAQNYGPAALSADQARQLDSTFASDFAAAMSLAPEPCCLSLLPIAALARRRRMT